MIRIAISQQFKRVCDQCFKKWGEEAQLFMLVEELAEVTQIMIHSWRLLKNPTTKGLAGEFADAFIMLSEWVHRLKIPLSMLHDTIDSKLDRLQFILKEGEE